MPDLFISKNKDHFQYWVIYNRSFIAGKLQEINYIAINLSTRNYFYSKSAAD